MRAVDQLLNAIVRFKEAENTVNNLSVPIDDTPEEAAFHAAIADVGSGRHIATTPAGAMAALRLLQKEMEAFAGSEMSKALIEGAMAYFDDIENRSPGVLEMALGTVGGLPMASSMEACGYAAVSDALFICSEAISGIISQPRCWDGDRDLSHAGKYLEQIESLLNFEQRRIIGAAARKKAIERKSDTQQRLQTILAFKAEDAELSVEQLEALISQIDEMDAGRAVA